MQLDKTMEEDEAAHLLYLNDKAKSIMQLFFNMVEAFSVVEYNMLPNHKEYLKLAIMAGIGDTVRETRDKMPVSIGFTKDFLFTIIDIEKYRNGYDETQKDTLINLKNRIGLLK